MICLLQIVNKSNINIYSESFLNTTARIWNAMQSEIEVNVSMPKFNTSSNMYLQEHSLQFNIHNMSRLFYHVLLFYHIVFILICISLYCISI